MPKDHFKSEPILKHKKVHGVVLGNLGLAYSALGDAKKAVEYYEQALKIDLSYIKCLKSQESLKVEY